MGTREIRHCVVESSVAVDDEQSYLVALTGLEWAGVLTQLHSDIHQELHNDNRGIALAMTSVEIQIRDQLKGGTLKAFETYVGAK